MPIFYTAVIFQSCFEHLNSYRRKVYVRTLSLEDGGCAAGHSFAIFRLYSRRIPSSARLKQNYWAMWRGWRFSEAMGGLSLKCLSTANLSAAFGETNTVRMSHCVSDESVVS